MSGSTQAIPTVNKSLMSLNSSHLLLECQILTPPPWTGCNTKSFFKLSKTPSNKKNMYSREGERYLKKKAKSNNNDC